jgi:hypothetical protein
VNGLLLAVPWLFRGGLLLWKGSGYVAKTQLVGTKVFTKIINEHKARDPNHLLTDAREIECRQQDFAEIVSLTKKII